MRYLHVDLNEEVEVMQVLMDNAEEVAEWCGGLLVQERNSNTNQMYPGINVPTHGETARASIQWYVVKDSGGGFHAVHPCTFVDTYKIIDEDEDPRIIEGGSPEFRDLHSGLTGREGLGFAPKPTTGFSD